MITSNYYRISITTCLQTHFQKHTLYFVFVSANAIEDSSNNSVTSTSLEKNVHLSQEADNVSWSPNYF